MSFDADTFMNTSLDAAFDTVIVPIPEGEYEAIIDDVAARQFQGKSIDENTGQPRQITTLDVTYRILDDRVAKEIGRDVARVKAGIFLDVTPEGQLDYGKGKNISLGRLREAVRQNDPNRPWMPGQLKGAGPVMIHVTQRTDPNKDGIIYNDVKSVTGV